MLRRAIAYGEKVFQLSSNLEALPDHRVKPQIRMGVFAKAILVLWLCRLPSLNALECTGRRGAGRRLLRHAMPCADQVANISEQLDVPALRALLGHMHKRLVRNKVLLPLRGHRLAVVDGHEISASYNRCCRHCQQREITVNDQKRIQYYHRAVVFMLVGPNFHFLLDFELLRRHDDEGSAALRMIRRVLKAYPRCFDILLGDGLYPQARIFSLLRRHGKHAIAVLKDERRDVLRDARGLFGGKPHLTYSEDKTRHQCWDIEHLDSWASYGQEVRVVRSIETTCVRSRCHGQWTSQEVIREWIWVTTLPADEVPTANIVCFGHERWRIENEAFNELCNQWHADHGFHHHPRSITNFWLMLFVAHGLFHCFMRNLKPVIRYSLPTYAWSWLMLAEFLLPLLSSA